MHRNFNNLKTKTMELEQIAKKYVHGLHDALTDKQEIKDMMTDIKTYAEEDSLFLFAYYLEMFTNNKYIT